MNQVELSAFKQYVSREADLLETAMREDLAEALQGCDSLLGEVLEYALFGGGKRIRPVLTVLSARICGRNDQELYRLAVAFEYLHVATLVHDDVIDNARERRGRDAVGHKFGMSAAILVGDWLHARSMHLVGRHAGSEGLEAFCRSTAGMVDGEFLQLRYVADPGVTEEQYFSVIHRKTALLIGSTCEIGSMFGGADQEQREALATYGHKLGTAFQVIDDLLDYQGNSASTGKKTGKVSPSAGAGGGFSIDHFHRQR
jgi:octaprenyl-diphosphate synthase